MELQKFSTRELDHVINSALYLADVLQAIPNQRRVSILMELRGLNSAELREIAERAKTRKAFLKAIQPPIEVAIFFGIEDRGYNTTSNGYIEAYSGEALIELEDGKKWRAVGHDSSGDAWSAYDGYIEFFPLNF